MFRLSMKTICIDYDGTYTYFPDLLNCIIDKSKQLGYKVICATMRYPHEEDPGLKSLREKDVEIIFTSREAKLICLSRLGINPDLWVEDRPIWLFENSH